MTQSLEGVITQLIEQKPHETLDSIITKKILVIIAGVTGVMGTEYAKEFTKYEDYEVMGISRKPYDSKELSFLSEEKYIQLEMSDKESCELFVKTIDTTKYEKIIYLHCAGKFKFEKDGVPESDLDDDGIDDIMYKSNYLTYKYVAESLAELTKKEHTKLTLVTFGSVGDKYFEKAKAEGEKWYWPSYSQCKKLSTDLTKKLSTESKDISGVHISISSAEHKDEKSERPLLTAEEKKYWLKAKEYVDSSIIYITSDLFKYVAIDIFKIHPGLVPDISKPESYYTDSELVRDTWHKAGGISE